jgi:hypothetical protein
METLRVALDGELEEEEFMAFEMAWVGGIMRTLETL